MVRRQCSTVPDKMRNVGPLNQIAARTSKKCASMAVDPGMQGKGIGRACLEEVRQICKKWPADAIRLDAYDAAAGAGEFYRKCGMREVGRAMYKTAPLIYFELMI